MKLSLLHRTLLLGVATSAQAATITWSAAQNVTGDTDIDLNGTLVQAYNLGEAAGRSINGVTFTGVTSSTSLLGPADHPYTAYGQPVFLTANSDYALALNSGNYFTAADTTSSLALKTLTIGHQYEFQVWYSDQRVGAGTTQMVLNSAGGTSVTLESITGTKAQYAIGTFVADASTQGFTLYSPVYDGPTINMYQLRDITAVPEPSACGLIGAGTLAAVSMVRRRRKHAGAGA